MDKREKVINGLECCTVRCNKCNECRYGEDGEGEIICHEDNMLNDALSLLKAQEPRVMTLIEVMAHDNRDGCIWYETIGISPAFVFCEGYRKQSGIIEILSPYFL